MSSIRAKDRDAVIQSLRAGVVPRAGQHLIQVGRVGELKNKMVEVYYKGTKLLAVTKKHFDVEAA